MKTIDCTGNKKLLPFYILKILQEFSDADNPLTQEKIAELLADRYKIAVERKAISRNIGWLSDDLNYEIGQIKGKGYYLISREFEDNELRLLIDSVKFSKTIPTRYSQELVEKLAELGSVKLREQLKSVNYISPKNKTKNVQCFYNIDEIAEAISTKKKISFYYNVFGEDGQLSPIWNEEIIVTPYDMVAQNGLYYLIGLIECNDRLTNFRIDRITKIKMLDADFDCDDSFDLKTYLENHPLMHSGDAEEAKIMMDNILWDDFIDIFGTDFTIIKQNETQSEVVFTADKYDIIDFAMRNAALSEVLAPESLRAKLTYFAQKMYEEYC